MKRWAWMLVASVVLFGSSACFQTNRVDIALANGIAVASNSALQMLVRAYQEEGSRAIEKANSREEAERALAGIQQKWEPVWAAWAILKGAHDTWANALETGNQQEAALGVFRAAYCGLMDVWPETVPAAPLAPVDCGGLNG